MYLSECNERSFSWNNHMDFKNMLCIKRYCAFISKFSDGAICVFYIFLSQPLFLFRSYIMAVVYAVKLHREPCVHHTMQGLN